MVSIFDYHNYKTFLNEAIRALPRGGHGARLRIAEFLGCQSTYISQVLTGPAHLSFEQAERMARFLELSHQEVDYFLLLVHENRAGTKELQARYQASREKMLEERKIQQERFHTPQPLFLEDQARYYSSWHYAAIHVLLTIPSFRDKHAIASRLSLPMETVNSTLDFLLRVGLVKLEQGEYQPGVGRIFLERGSPLISKLHQNWRLQAMARVDVAKPDDLHYSTVITISEEDFGKIRADLLQAITAARETIRKSKEEKLCSFCVDFYEL